MGTTVPGLAISVTSFEHMAFSPLEEANKGTEAAMSTSRTSIRSAIRIVTTRRSTTAIVMGSVMRAAWRIGSQPFLGQHPEERLDVDVAAAEDDAHAPAWTSSPPFRRGATTTALEGSITILSRSQTNRVASMISASVAVTMASTWREMTAKVLVPSEVRRPSAMVLGSMDGWIVPVSSERRASSAFAGSAPTTFVSGERPLTRQRGAREEPAAADGGDHDVERPGLFEQLQRRGPLAGDHVPVVERVNERETVGGDLGGHGGLARFERRLAEHDPRPVALGRGPLDRGGRPGHDDRHRHAEQLTGQGQGLGVVPGGMRDHTGGLAALIQLQERIHRSAELERADALKILALEEDGRAAR